MIPFTDFDWTTAATAATYLAATLVFCWAFPA